MASKYHLFAANGGWSNPYPHGSLSLNDSAKSEHFEGNIQKKELMLIKTPTIETQLIPTWDVILEMNL